jgi:predicted nucleotidyltransferase
MCSRTILNQITDQVTNAVKDSLGEKLDKVILYGSYARGDYDDESDIDILVLANIPHEDELKEYKKINQFISRLGLEHDIVVTVNITDCKTFYEYIDDLPFFKTVQREGVVLNAQ